MKHVNKCPLALYVCMNSIFKCFIGNRIEWSHIEWHFFSNWQVLLIPTSPCYCLLGSIYSLVKMYARVGKGTLAFLADPELSGVRNLPLPHGHPNSPPTRRRDSLKAGLEEGSRLGEAGISGLCARPVSHTALHVSVCISFCLDTRLAAGYVCGDARGGALGRAAGGWHLPRLLAS